jgi:hypothetical protein
VYRTIIVLAECTVYRTVMVLAECTLYRTVVGDGGVGEGGVISRNEHERGYSLAAVHPPLRDVVDGIQESAQSDDSKSEQVRQCVDLQHYLHWLHLEPTHLLYYTGYTGYTWSLLTSSY